MVKKIFKKDEISPLKGVDIYISEDVRVGVYANITNVSVGDNEVNLLFIHRDPDNATAVSKVIVSRLHAKKIADIILDGLKKMPPKKEIV